jgi:HD superfamily phosphohydrolase YqeK
MLSFDDNPVLNVCDNSNKHKRDDETSSKLWHGQLGHISKGRIGLIREEILQTVHRQY